MSPALPSLRGCAEGGLSPVCAGDGLASSLPVAGISLVRGSYAVESTRRPNVPPHLQPAGSLSLFVLRQPECSARPAIIMRYSHADI